MPPRASGVCRPRECRGEKRARTPAGRPACSWRGAPLPPLARAASWHSLPQRTCGEAQRAADWRRAPPDGRQGDAPPPGHVPLAHGQGFLLVAAPLARNRLRANGAPGCAHARRSRLRQHAEFFRDWLTLRRLAVVPGRGGCPTRGPLGKVGIREYAPLGRSSVAVALCKLVDLRLQRVYQVGAGKPMCGAAS